ncbi:hypothetical protein PR202_ga08275 [Eleusine coracana subsp. coracana]|uniref:Uncharacterized protein n=1 Tax=Eleusine coracana subsp. coracana TaxID=191504 RepID=A0AAV5C277_ELECO|nr:hypothetical protein QOZ80_1AG0046940 [Eleusine coracana subsp. coracana]GJM91857.1 hypothetical protein PR202_ga08275 [Eleusine coracana subsp. coracana]
MSRHRRQPSRALPLDFIVDDGQQAPPITTKGATSSLEGSQTPARSGNDGGGRGDAAAGAGKVIQEGQATNKKPPSGTGGRTLPEGNGSTGAR